jgi:hypothetical protein
MRKIIKTRVADIRDPSGRIREAVWCALDCGHHVIRYCSARRAYVQAQCLWCNLEARDEVRYVWRKRAQPYDLGDDAPDYVPEVLP